MSGVHFPRLLPLWGSCRDATEGVFGAFRRTRLLCRPQKGRPFIR
jgi:hypothetical protein